MTTVIVLAWSPGIREGMSNYHLEIAFLRVTRVSQLEVIYVPGTRRLHRYRLQASNDGRNWWNHLQVCTELGFEVETILERKKF